MRILDKLSLHGFKLRHADSCAPLDAWEAEAEAAEWKSVKQIKALYRSLSVISSNQLAFSFINSQLKLGVKIHFERGVLLIENIGMDRKGGRPR